MGLTEIILLIAGCGIFVASFVLPEKKRGISKDDIKLGETQVKKLVEQEMQGAKDKISDLVDETITYGVEKTERSLDRLSNEKIMAINEYSDTVLEAINTNHKEAMFLYDMLNNKQDSLKETVKEASQAERKVKEAAEMKAAEVFMPEKTVQTAQVMTKTDKEASVTDTADYDMPDTDAADTKAVNTEDKGAAATEASQTPEAKKTEKTAKPKRQSAGKTSKATKAADKAGVNIQFTAADEGGKNNNEKILTLHKQGKSNMAIAKELGLGIGEVKLVIDLFQGI